MQRLGRLLSTVFAACLVVLSARAVAAEARFPTPEAAITTYIEGVARQDFRAVLAATAVDDMAKGFDFVSYVDRLKSLGQFSPAPSSDPFFIAINRASFTAQIAKQLQFLAYGLMTTSDILQGKTVGPLEAEDATAFAASVDPARLSGLAVVKVGAPNPTALNSEVSKRNQARQAAVYGAVDATDRIALLSFEGETFMVGFGLMRFGEDWKVITQSSALAGTAATGVPGPMTPEQFELMLQ